MRRNESIAAAFGRERPHKYGARATVIDTIRFPSKREALRYKELRLLQSAGEITELEIDAVRPIQYPLSVHGTLICTYRPDFRYRQDGETIVEDCKGFRTPVFRLKAKLFNTLYPQTRLLII